MRRLSSFILAPFVLAMALASSANAGLVMMIANLTEPVGGTGTFEVLLANTDGPGGSTFDVASFSFGLSIPGASGIHFTAAETSTASAPYLFDGTGGASIDPDFELSLDDFPNSGFVGSDTAFLVPSIALHPGSVFGLGLVSFSISSAAPAGTVLISFVTDATSLSDALGNPIDFSTDDREGIIQVQVVPEPGSFALSSIAVVALATLHRRRTTLLKEGWAGRHRPCRG